MKYLAIGDSITAARANLTVYTQLLAAPLASFGTFTFDYAVSGAGIVNHGHGGWATGAFTFNGELFPGFVDTWTTEVSNENADIVSIMLGANDSAANQTNTAVRIPLADYSANLTTFITRLRAQNPAVKIILMSPTPCLTLSGSPVPSRSNASVARYALACKKVATANNVPFLDVYNYFWELSGKSESVMNSVYTLDGVHLNQAGQNLLYDMLLPVINSFLSPDQSTTAPFLFTGGDMQVGGYGITETIDFTGMSRGRILIGFSRGRISCGY